MSLLKNHKKNFLCSLVLCLAALAAVTACNHKASEVKTQEGTDLFRADPSLDRYIDKIPQDTILEAEPGADTPMLLFANDKYIGVLCLKGILIFSSSSGKLSTVLDTEGLGFEETQGDQAILDYVNNDCLVLYKAGEHQGYMYSFKEKALSKIDDIDKLYPNKNVYDELTLDACEKIWEAIGDTGRAVQYKDHFVALKTDYENVKNTSVYVLDEKFNIVLNFKIGSEK